MQIKLKKPPTKYPAITDSYYIKMIRIISLYEIHFLKGILGNYTTNLFRNH